VTRAGSGHGARASRLTVLMLVMAFGCGTTDGRATGGTQMGRDAGSGQGGEAGAYRGTSAIGMTFEWRVQGDMLHGRMRAPTRGWVAVGFNHRPTLDGTRLVMGYVRDGATVVEEHVAAPPVHHRKRDLGWKEGLGQVSGTEDARSTFIEFTLALDTGEPRDVALVPGRTYHLTLAWSHEDDLQHHSAMRTAVDVTL
jgi:hypothetical protein